MPLPVLITPVENTDSIRPFQKQAIHLIMLLQLEDTSLENINMLMKFAVQHDLKLSVIDEIGDDYLLPGKPFSPEQLTQLVEKSRKSGMIALENAHTFIRKAYEPINYTTDALNSLISLVNFIKSKNTAGAGLRWLNR